MKQRGKKLADSEESGSCCAFTIKQTDNFDFGRETLFGIESAESSSHTIFYQEVSAKCRLVLRCQASGSR